MAKPAQGLPHPALGLKARAIAVVFLVLAGAVAALTWRATSRLKQDLEQILAAERLQAANMVAHTIGVDLAERRKELAQLAIDLAVACPDGEAAALRAIERERIANARFPLGVRYTVGDGLVAAYPAYADRGRYKLLRDKPLADNDAARSGVPLVMLANGRVAVLLREPVNCGQGAAPRLLEAPLAVEGGGMFDFIEAQQVAAAAGFLVMSREDNLFVFATDSSRIMNRLPAPGVNAMHDRYMAGYEGWGVAANSRGVVELSAAHNVPGTDWFVVTAVPADVAFAPVKRLEERLVTDAMVAVALLLAALWLTLSVVLGPLDRLAAALWRMARGESAIGPLELGGGRELRQIAAAFNELIAMLTRERHALKDSEERLRLMADESPVLLRSTDAMLACRWANKTWHRATGTGARDTEDDGWLRAVFHDDRATLESCLRQTRDAGIPYQAEYRLHFADGTLHWILEVGVPHQTEQGSFVGVISTGLDITEIREARQAARESSQHYAGLLEASPSGVMETDAYGRCTYVNERWIDICGQSAEEASGLGWLRSIDEHERTTVLSAWTRHADSEGTRHIEYRIPRRQNHASWVQAHVATLRDAGGTPTGTLAMVIDITERKRGDEMLSGILAEQNAILDNALIGIVMLRNRTVVSTNRRLEEIFGYDTGELIGQSSRVFYSTQELFERIGVDAYACVSRGDNYSTELLLQRKTGEFFWGALSGRAIDPARPHDGSIWIYADISEHKQAEEAQRKLQRAVEQISMSIVITNRDGIIEYVNPAFSRITGYSRLEAVGQNPRLLQSGETPPETYRELWGAITAGRNWNGVLRNRRKNGELMWEEVTISPVTDEQDVITHFVAVKEDITARRLNEEALERHRTELETLVTERTGELRHALEVAKVADQAKDAFLANMSHEIRTPMNGILGLSRLLLHSPVSATQRDQLRKIQGAGDHLLGVINDILDMSKIRAGKLQLEQRAFALAGVLDEVRAVFDERAREKGLALLCRDAEGVPPVLVGDALRLRQILFNLVGNAIKFTEQGTVSLDVTLTRRKAEHVLLEFSVRDTGIGMSATEIERLFHPFVQADASTTRRFGGTGLGLVICRQLAELMEGDLTVNSSPGRGSTFIAHLRFAVGSTADLATSPAPEIDEATASLAGVRLFLAEDQPLNREVACGLLASAGASVDTAENGREAVDRLLAAGPGAYDLVLMDIQMPEMDGLAAAAALRAAPGFATLPIVAMTAHVLPEERQKSLAAGMNDHIGKPFEPADLFARIRALLPAGKRPAGGVPPAPTLPGTPAAEAPPVAHGGIDIAAALPRFGRRRETYARWLRTFATEVPALVGDTARALEGGDTVLAKRHAHSCKGQAGTLGLLDLHAAATALDDSLKQGEQDAALFEAFRREAARAATLAEACAADLMAGTAAAEDGSARATPPSAAALDLGPLRAAIVASDGDAAVLCTSLRSASQGPDAAWLADIAARLEAFDYDGALALLDTARP